MENRRSKILSKTPMVQKVIDVYKISYKELEDIYNEIQKVRKLDDIYYHLKQDKGFLEMIKKIYDEKEIYIDSGDRYNDISLKRSGFHNDINLKIPNLKVKTWIDDIRNSSAEPDVVEVLLDENDDVEEIIIDFNSKNFYDTIIINEKMFNSEKNHKGVFVINDRDTIDYLINNVVTLKEIFEVLSVYTETKVNEEYENLKKQEMEMSGMKYRTIEEFNEYLMNDERFRNLYLKSNQYDFIRKNLYERLRPHSDFEYWYGGYYNKKQPYELHQLIEFLYKNYNTMD